MPERPLLRLPTPVSVDRRPGPRAISKVVKPGYKRQARRLEPRFERLTRVVENASALLELRHDPSSIAPERAIVFEVAGYLPDFYQQAKNLGLEYLGDFEDDIEPDQDFYDKKKPEAAISGRIYLAMPDVRALQELLRLWERYRVDQQMPRGRAPWRDLFDLLVDVRPWGSQDRVPPETQEFWERTLSDRPDFPVRFEIEVWFHENPERRATTQGRLQIEVGHIGGEIVHSAVIPEIRYHAFLVDVPPDQVRRLLENPDITLARVDDVMFLRPQSVARHPGKEEPEGEDHVATTGQSDLDDLEPIAALLDGLPIQNHTLVEGRLKVEDPDNLEETYPVARREHGTAMASLIIHGDLNRIETPISRPLFVLPVMQPAATQGECTSPDKLLVDSVYRAVLRIKEGEGDQPPSAPEVSIINFSLGDPWRLFPGR